MGVKCSCVVTEDAKCGKLFPANTPATNERERDDNMLETMACPDEPSPYFTSDELRRLRIPALDPLDVVLDSQQQYTTTRFLFVPCLDV